MNISFSVRLLKRKRCLHSEFLDVDIDIGVFYDVI